MDTFAKIDESDLLARLGVADDAHPALGDEIDFVADELSPNLVFEHLKRSGVSG